MSIAWEVPTKKPMVHVVDDDKALRSAVAWMLGGAGYQVRTYGTAKELLDVLDTSCPSCVVRDVRMPGMSGLELQAALAQQVPDIPVVLITAHGDVPMAVEAVSKGAFDFIEKPFDNAVLRRAVAKAMDQALGNFSEKSAQIEARAALSKLTTREREVFELVASGHTSKAIARQLDIKVKTIEVHRSRMMEKLGAKSLAEIVDIFRATDNR